MSQRSEWIDIAKGLCVSLMVLHHLVKELAHSGLLTLSPAYEWADLAIGAWRMPLFFAIAGLWLVPCLHKYGSAGLLRRRADTILWPYMLWMVLHTLTQIVMGQFAHRQAPPLSDLVMLWPPRHHYWFLGNLMLLTVIGIGVASVVPRRWHPLAALVALLCYFIPQPDSLAVKHIPTTVGFFLLGAALEPYVGRLQTMARVWLIPTAGFAIVIAGAIYVARADIVGYTPARMALALVSMAALLPLCVVFAGSRWSGWLAKIGSASVAVYLAHFAGVALSRIVLQRGLGVTDPAVHIICGLLAGIALPYCIYRSADRLRIGWLFQLPKIISTRRLRPKPKPLTGSPSTRARWSLR